MPRTSALSVPAPGPGPAASAATAPRPDGTPWPQAVVFDLDGTLIDSAADLASLLNRILEEEGIAPFPVMDVRGFIGDGIRSLIAKALRTRSVPASDARLDALRDRLIARYLQEPVVQTRVFPGAAALLADLAAAGVAMAVCTNKAEAPARLILERLGLADHIKVLVGGDSGHGFKPSSAPLLACAAALGVGPMDMVYVGDHAIDVMTGLAAGVPVVLVAFGAHGPAEPGIPGADRVITDFADLPDALQDLAESLFP